MHCDVLGIDVDRATSEQQLEYLMNFGLNAGVQGRSSLLVLAVRVDSLLEQLLHLVASAVPHCDVKWRLTLGRFLKFLNIDNG